ncbi:CT214 family putative inclusion membrane protein [Chlamydia vaughanii]|uniref:CT214 family putative inclusion membrane protein n=1 Tax=Chlamydia vaughanii TaxID=3112552 RepID=UPI0032B120F7
MDSQGYNRFVSRDVIILVILFAIIAILSIIGAVLVGSNVLACSIAVLCVASISLVFCLVGVILIALLNAEKWISPKIVLPDEIEFSSQEQEFLQSLVDLPVSEEIREIMTPSISEDSFERVFIDVGYYRDNPAYKENIANRVAKLEQSLIDFSNAVIKVVIHSGRTSEDLIQRIIREIRDLFIPSFSSRQQETTLCYCLKSWVELLQQHSCVDFIVLILEKPHINRVLLEHLISLAGTWEDQRGDPYYISAALQSFNLWLFGLFKGEKCIEMLEEYNADLLTEEVRSCLTNGNFVQLICSQIEPELLNRFTSLLPSSLESLSAMECRNVRRSMNSDGYVNNDPFLRAVIDNLNLRMTFCLNLPDCSSWGFRFALARNLTGIFELNAFIKENYPNLIANPFLIMELFHGHMKYQSFVQGLLAKAMPISYWKLIFTPMIAGLFSAGIANKQEIEVMASHLGVRYEDLISVIASNSTLEELFPGLFKE